jgi:hypothetical protein
MVQRSKNPGFAFEARQAIPIVSESGRQCLDGNITSKFGVAPAVNLSHPAGTEEPDNFARSNASP